MENEVELKPCPFKHSIEQGSRATEYEPYADDSMSEDSNWCVICPVCKSTSGFYDTEQQAVGAWQSRAASPAPDTTGAVEAFQWTIDSST